MAYDFDICLAKPFPDRHILFSYAIMENKIRRKLVYHMLTKEIPAALAKELHIRPKQAEAVIELLDTGNTVPFIARYRKEATGSLEDEQLRLLEERLTYLRSLVERQEEILAKIEEQGKLTDTLRTSIEKAARLQDLEDLYLPYKQKKRTRAQIARERGLEPLANAMLLQQQKTCLLYTSPSPRDRG